MPALGSHVPHAYGYGLDGGGAAAPSAVKPEGASARVALPYGKAVALCGSPDASGRSEAASESERAVATDVQPSEHRPPRRGFLNPQMVRGRSFWTTSVCLRVAVGAGLLAIWEFTGTDMLWRTVATGAVIGGGTIAFAWINTLFGDRRD